MLKSFFIFLSFIFLTACSGWFDKDNTPTPSSLVKFNQRIYPKKQWSLRTGGGAEDENIKLSPSMNTQSIFTASVNGTVTSIDKITGNRNWQTRVNAYFTSGPGNGDGLVVVGGRRGNIFAFDINSGAQKWNKTIQGEIIASPVIKNGIVIIKAINGHVYGLDVNNGHSVWSSEQVEPALILRGSSTPALSGNNAFIGFANGNLVKLNISNGQLSWMKAIATPEGAFNIQRMIDIDADPIVYGHHVFAATYQGRIASLDWTSGRNVWSYDISSYTGMAADDTHLFITDAQGYLWSFNINNGTVNWRQTKLKARVLSGPVLLGEYIIVGDKEGYLHWMNKNTGEFLAREYAGGPIVSTPLVSQRTLYAYTSQGDLIAYQS